MSRVNVTDTILRDAHQCLIATRMRTEDMLPICPKLDEVGFWSLEVWGGATFDACMRFLKEDPWERLKQLREALPNTRLQMLLRGQNLLGYRHYSDDVVRAFVKLAAKNGVDVFRIFDALNDTRNLETAIAAVKEADKHAQGAISYTVSPVHATGLFVEMAKKLEAMGCDSVAIKDMAGLLTPFTAFELVSQLKEAVTIPIHVHSHSTAGLADMCMLKAAEAGCDTINTAISAFAGGASHPPTESMVAAFAGTPYDTGLNLELLQEIGFYFYAVRKKYHHFESEYTGVDTRVQVTQVPGGMVSNLVSQLREQGALDKMAAVMAEIPKVREDLGYPPLVTPTSQIVGSQAVINVLNGERYKTVTNEVKAYLKGRYGQPAGEINSVVRKLAIGDEEVITVRPADLMKDEMDELRAAIGDLAQSEEDVLSYAMFPEVGRDFLSARKAGTLVPEPLEPIDPGKSSRGPAPTEFNLTIHGETYHIQLKGTGHRTQEKRPFYLTVDGMPEEVIVESLHEIPMDPGGAAGTVHKGSRRPPARDKGDVTTSMPGTIVEILVKEGDEVSAGDPVIVTEAMKMETEIQAPIAGKVQVIHVSKGDSVNPDEALIEIRPA